MAQGPWDTGTWDAALWDSLPIIGNSSTGSVGNVGVESTAPLAGDAAAGAVGVVSVAATIPTTGESAAAAVGSVGVAVTLALSGEQAVGQVGSENVSTTALVTGIAATGAVGAVGVDITVALAGNGATGSVGTVTAGAPPIIVVEGGHDGKRFKKILERERLLKEKKRQAILDAFEQIVEGRPELAEEISAPFIVMPTASVPLIDYDEMLADLDRVQRIWEIYMELDDEDVLILL